MVFHGEYDRRYDQASLVSSIFTFPMSQRLLEQEPRGISSDLVVHQNRPANSHICAHPCVRDGPVMQHNHLRYALSRSTYHRCLVHPTLQEDTSMRRRREGCVHRTQARRHPACLPRAELPEAGRRAPWDGNLTTLM